MLREQRAGAGGAGAEGALVETGAAREAWACWGPAPQARRIFISVRLRE